MFETVIYDYKLGHITERFTRGGIAYAAANICGANVVAREENFIPVAKFLDLARRAELEPCNLCHTTGKIDPIENPPYTCPSCDGKGYHIVKEF